MSKNKMVHILRTFQKAPEKSELRSNYFSAFEKKMLYRTTKTEHPKVTLKMVNKVLHKLSNGSHA